MLQGHSRVLPGLALLVNHDTKEQSKPRLFLSKVGHLGHVHLIKVLFTYLGCHYFKFFDKNLIYHNSRLSKNE